MGDIDDDRASHISSQSLQSIPATAAESKVAWNSLAWVMLTDVVGTSILTLAGVAATMGWVMTVVTIISGALVAFGAAMLMSRTYQLVSARDKWGLEVRSMGEAGRLVLGGSRGASAIYFGVYGNALLGNASYLLVLGKALQGVFWDSRLCLPNACAIACACLLPIVVSVRQIGESVTLCFCNLFLILGVIACVEYDLVDQGRADGVYTAALPPDLTFTSFFGAVTNVLYAYGGHWIFFEMIATLDQPSHFPRIFLINLPLQVSLNLVVACTGYYYRGDGADGYLLDNMPLDRLYRISSALLFVHVCVNYTLVSTVLSRFVHANLWPDQVDVLSRNSRLQYALIAVAQLCFGFIVACSIPEFQTLLGLIGGLLAAPICFGFPCIFFLGAVARYGHDCTRDQVQSHLSVHGSKRRQEDSFHSAASPDVGQRFGKERKLPDRVVADCAAAHGDEYVELLCAEFNGIIEHETLGAWAKAVIHNLCSGFTVLPLHEKLLLGLLLSFVLLAMVVGTYSNILTLLKIKPGAPFSCCPGRTE